MSTTAILDGNQAAAHIAYRLSDVVAIYPITPASPMSEWADAWSAKETENLWGSVPRVVEMQSEAGAAAVVHGALQTGALASTFTASQGLLLMIPEMYKIAGQMLPGVMHVASRAIATQALSIFGDHSDVMAVRGTGFAILASGSVQESMDMALVAHAAALRIRIPFIHFFDGFRTSHELNKIEIVSDEQIRSMIDEEWVLNHRRRGLSPDRPVIRGTSQNPDVYFQSREASNRYYDSTPAIVSQLMDKLAGVTGRKYGLFEYAGHPSAESVVAVMGSAGETVEETVRYLVKRGEKVGVVKVRLFRPFDVRRFVDAFPKTTRHIAVLDRSKEPGSAGEALYLDCVNAVQEAWSCDRKRPVIIGGRYGLSSKEFTPAMAASVFEEMVQCRKPTNHFTVGIHDDLTKKSLLWEPDFSLEKDDVYRALFFGLGSDGTVGANKNSIQIAGEGGNIYPQGYFVYDSKKAGSVTVSHLRFSPRPVRAPYLISKAHFIGCHQESFVGRIPMMDKLLPGGTFLLNSSIPASEIWDTLPAGLQKGLFDKKARFYVVDANRAAKEAGLSGKINTIMQMCFFELSRVIPLEIAKRKIEEAIEKTYRKKGAAVVEKNLFAVRQALNYLYEVDYSNKTVGSAPSHHVSRADNVFIDSVVIPIIEGRGDELPVSALPADGTFPVGTARLEKRGIAGEIPVWEPRLCIQCGKCSMICPHAAIRIKVFDHESNGKDADFLSVPAMDAAFKGRSYTIQVAPDDCTGCALCVDVCPAKDKTTEVRALHMETKQPILESQRRHWEHFLELHETDRGLLNIASVRQQQIQQPLFEFSGACSGCGETPYLKLLSQLFGDRMLVANATGCSSIYGGNLPTTPWSKNCEGRGPAWANSLFEDNAEFGLGFRLSLNQQKQEAERLLKKFAASVGKDLAESILGARQENEAAIFEQRERIVRLRGRLLELEPDAEMRRLLEVADLFARKTVWIVGGDGWAYDIGFGGLDHVLSSGEDVNILVMDTQVYSNTGGQMSKATPKGAVAKFAASGKKGSSKDLGLMAMTYGNVYVARIAMGAKDEHTLKTFLEAEAFDGPSLIIAYAHCIEHGYSMSDGLKHQKAAVDSGFWPLYRYNPKKIEQGVNPFVLDSGEAKIPLEKFLTTENRFNALLRSSPESANRLFSEASHDLEMRKRLYKQLAEIQVNGHPKHHST